MEDARPDPDDAAGTGRDWLQVSQNGLRRATARIGLPGSTHAAPSHWTPGSLPASQWRKLAGPGWPPERPHGQAKPALDACRHEVTCARRQLQRDRNLTIEKQRPGCGVDISKLARRAQSLAELGDACGNARQSFVRKWKERQVASLQGLSPERDQVNAGHQRHEPEVVRMCEPWSDLRALHYHLTELQHGLYIGVIGYVAADLLRVRVAGRQESFD